MAHVSSGDNEVQYPTEEVEAQKPIPRSFIALPCRSCNYVGSKTSGSDGYLIHATVVLLLMQFCEPIPTAVILPFVFRLINETGVTQGRKNRTNYYVGIIVRSFLLDFAPVPGKESAFFLGQALFTLLWGRLSDRISRKPVLLIGIFGLALSILCVGLSRSFPALVIIRILAAELNGNVSALKAMMGEITDDTNAAQGFAFIPMVLSTGSRIACVYSSN